MKIDNLVQEFCEKYDRDAIKSIEDISTDIGLNQNNVTIKGFNMKEAFESYTAYLKGYAEFMELAAVKGSNEEKTMQNSSEDEVSKSFEKYIDTQVIKEASLVYRDLPSFVTSFISGSQKLVQDIEEIKESMLNANVSNDLVGDINVYTDKFVDKLVESMNPVMNEILWASGYNSKKKLFAEKSKRVNVFV